MQCTVIPKKKQRCSVNSVLQDTKECYITHATEGLHKHHIFFGTGNRKISEQNGFWVYLRSDFHNGANYGVHGKDGHALDITLKAACQRKYEETHSREEFMKLIGRNYIED